MLSLGIDYGTKSWKTALLDEEEVRDLRSFSTSSALLGYLDELFFQKGGLPTVLPSGFGIPLKKLSQIDDEDIFEMTLRRERPQEAGLGKFLVLLRDRGVEAYCIPAVKLLPTVPVHRKLNRIDLGTSDKLCSIVFVLATLARGGMSLPEMSFLVIEVGYAFKCLLVVLEGRVVDGQGGTSGFPGPRARGSLDGEVAYLHHFDKKGIYSGGYLDLKERFGPCGEMSFLEGVEKEMLMLMSFYGLDRILVTGRRKEYLLQKLGGRYPLEVPGHDQEGYEAALGAAMVANGLEGGTFADLIRHLGIAEARDRVLDWIYV